MRSVTIKVGDVELVLEQESESSALIVYFHDPEDDDCTIVVTPNDGVAAADLKGFAAGLNTAVAAAEENSG